MTPRIAFAPGAALVRRTVRTSLAVAALTCGTSAAAFAQTVPAAPLPVTAPVAADAAAQPATTAAATPQTGAPSTVAQGPAGGPPGPVRPAPPAPPFSHLPVIDFVVTFTQPGVYNNMSQLPAYDPIDLGGTVRIPVSRKLNLLFDRIVEGTVNQPLERSAAGAGGIFAAPCTSAPCSFLLPKDTRDVILQYHATWTFNRYLTMDVGDSFRHRIFSSGAGTAFALGTNISAQPYPYTLSSTEHHFGYLGFSYITKPWKELWNSVFVLSETLDVQNVDHHVAVTSSCLPSKQPPAPLAVACGGGAVNYLDENTGTNRYFETTQGVTWLLPVDAKHGTTFLVNERWGYLNFYENAFVPYRWPTALTFQLSKRFSPGFTLAMRHSDYHSSTTQNAPFTNPNAIHVGSWDIIGTFHVDTNTFFAH